MMNDVLTISVGNKSVEIPWDGSELDQPGFGRPSERYIDEIIRPALGALFYALKGPDRIDAEMAEIKRRLQGE